MRAFVEVEPLDRSVLSAARDRDPRALDRFFQTYAPGVYRLAFRMIGETSGAEVVSQEVFYRVHRAIHQLDIERDPEPWLVAITCNACRRFWQKTQAEQRRSLPLESVSEEIATDETSPSDRRERESEIQAVQRALAELPAPLRETIVLHAYQDLGHDEIARALGISHTAARKRYSRAVTELGRRLSRWLGGERR